MEITDNDVTASAKYVTMVTLLCRMDTNKIIRENSNGKTVVKKKIPIVVTSDIHITFHLRYTTTYGSRLLYGSRLQDYGSKIDFMFSSTVSKLNLMVRCCDTLGNIRVQAGQKTCEYIKENWYNVVENINFSGEFTIEFFIDDVGYESKCEIYDDFNNLLNNADYSDVTLKSAEGVEFKAHKNILACRSEVFRAHFKHNTTECTTNTCETPLEADILSDLLEYIYSGKTSNINDVADKLLAAADYYGLQHLKLRCGEVLSSQLTVKNALKLLQLADLHSAPILKNNVLQFLKNIESAKAIVMTEDWSNFKDTELIKEILRNIVI